MKHSHYKRDISHLQTLDLYRVCQLFGITDAALSHAVKKVMFAGARGAKDAEKDIQEAIDSLQRWQEMRKEDAHQVDPAGAPKAQLTVLEREAVAVMNTVKAWRDGPGGVQFPESIRQKLDGLLLFAEQRRVLP